MPKLTLIMPAYNAASFIEEAIASLLEQTFTDFELWLVDDGSTDATRAKMELFQDLRIKRFYFDENRGRVVTMNEMVQYVETEYVTITDADDVSHPTRIEKQITLLDQKPEVAMCGTSYWAMDESGILIRSMNLSDDYNYIQEANLAVPQFHGPTSIFRTRLLRELTEFYRLYFRTNMADTDLAARVVDKFPSVNLTEPLYFYRIVRTSVSRKEFSFRFALIDRTISFLSKQRRSSGFDSLQKPDSSELEKFIKDWEVVYAADPARLHREAAFYHLYWKVTGSALASARQAILKRPLAIKNLFCLAYCSVMSLIYRVNRLTTKHYSELMR
ncbi:MAG: glycosyltransferase family 2 protein [Cyclobacteriaceae bacterium]|nr:glycosyltransferase family 2 protein [Cyclobacteriaceae bacterium]